MWSHIYKSLPKMVIPELAEGWKHLRPLGRGFHPSRWWKRRGRILGARKWGPLPGIGGKIPTPVVEPIPSGGLVWDTIPNAGGGNVSTIFKQGGHREGGAPF